MTDGDDRAVQPENCELALDRVDAEGLSKKSVTDQIEVLSALSNETRYRILLFLVAADQPVCGCELEPHLDVGQSTISQSLTRLHKVGLVTRTKEGRWRYYEQTPTAEQLVELVEEMLDRDRLVAD